MKKISIKVGAVKINKFISSFDFNFGTFSSSMITISSDQRCDSCPFTDCAADRDVVLFPVGPVHLAALAGSQQAFGVECFARCQRALQPIRHQNSCSAHAQCWLSGRNLHYAMAAANISKPCIMFTLCLFNENMFVHFNLISTKYLTTSILFTSIYSQNLKGTTKYTSFLISLHSF